MSEEPVDDAPGGMGAIKGDPVTDSDEPGGMSGIPDPDPDADTADD
jgi:hypothetical protein